MGNEPDTHTGTSLESTIPNVASVGYARQGYINQFLIGWKCYPIELPD